MLKKVFYSAMSVTLVLVLLLTTLGGCVKQNVPTEPAGTPDAEVESGRADGERFEEVIMLEGMEETVKYEHVRNESLGFELDYDYESLTRISEPGRELFVSVYDDPESPENYLEVSYSAESAETVVDSIGRSLSEVYDISGEACELERAGSCVKIDASAAADGSGTPDFLQTVYVIRSGSGCIIAAAHYGFEAAEGFGARFSYIVNTIAVIEQRSAGQLPERSALDAIRNYCLSANPELEEIVNAGEYPVYWEISSSDENEVVVLFRSYTGAQIFYYIDRASGNVYVTEFVSGITDGEEPTDESFNVRDYLAS